MPQHASPSSKPGLLVLDRFTEATEAGFEASFTVHRFYAEGLSLDTVAGSIEAIATSGAKGASNAVINRLPALRIVAIRGVGTDAVDLENAHRKGVAVTTTPNLLTDDVADLAMGLLLACARGVCSGDRFVRDGRWRPGSSLSLGRKVTGMRIGVVGLGRVGRAIARRAEAFETTVAYTDVKAFGDVAYRFAPSVLDLAKDCDALVLAASGGPQSLRIVDGAVLDALGPNGLMINV
jgi:hydroxypyruvate reductase